MYYDKQLLPVYGTDCGLIYFTSLVCTFDHYIISFHNKPYYQSYRSVTSEADAEPRVKNQQQTPLDDLKISQ
jgi:hypothetical protein